MSAQEQQPSQYIMVAGTQLALPYDARIDLAYTNNYPISNAGFGNALYQNKTGAYVIPLSFTVEYGANAVAGNRLYLMGLYTSKAISGTTQVWIVPTPTAVAANSIFWVDYIAGSGTSFSASAVDSFATVWNYGVVAVPVFVLSPGFALAATEVSPSSDTINNVGDLYALVVPAGPPRVTSTAAPLPPTPILV